MRTRRAKNWRSHTAGSEAGLLFFAVTGLAAAQMFSTSTSAECGASFFVNDVVAFMLYGKRTTKCHTPMSQIVPVQSRPLYSAFAG